MSKPASRRGRKMELDAAIEIAKINRDDHVYRDLIKYIFFAFSIGMGYLAIDSLAGQVTVADIKVLGKVAVGDAGPSWGVVLASILFGVSGVLLARKERNLRKDTVERMHKYQELWEKSIDPKRSTSAITSRGDTRPEDK